MKKLELKHLAPYLPYELKITARDNNVNQRHSTLGFRNSGLWRDLLNESRKPILRPLSDLTKEIEHNGEKFVPMVELLKARHPHDDYNSKYGEIDCEQHPSRARAYYKCRANFALSVFTLQLSSEKYWIIEKLFEWHFDVFGLIEQNLAITKIIMGELAEDIIDSFRCSDGSRCSLCDVHFKHPKTNEIYVHCYLVACDDCWDENCGYEKQDKGIPTF